MANIITSLRILCGAALLFCPVFSPVFYALYLFAGFTDMIDGTVARKTNTVSEFGAKLDSIADFVFVLSCLIKLIPAMDIPVWLYLWIGIIAAIKIMNVVSGFLRWRQLVVEHSVMNKVTGGLLFIFPLTLRIVDLKYSAAVVCAVATFAAIQEGHFIRAGKNVE